MAYNNFGFFPNGNADFQKGFQQGYNAPNPSQQNNNQAQKQSKRSPAYEIAAKVIFYNQKEGGTLKEKNWTPHDIKSLSLFREMLVVERYGKKDYIIKFRSYAFAHTANIGEPAFYTNMFDFLFSLDRGTSAKVKNIRDIKIFYGEDKGVPREVAFLLANSLDHVAEKEKIYPNVLLLPEGCYDQLPNILEEGRMSLIKSHIAGYGAERVFLTQDKKTLSWKVSDKKPMNKEAEVDEKGNLPDEHTHTSFGLKNQHTLFKNIISDAAALQEYIRLHPNARGVSVEICGEPLMMSRLWTDASIYPGDTALRDYFSKHIYRPAAVWEFISGFEPVEVTEKFNLAPAHELGTIYNIAYRTCSEASENSYRYRMTTSQGKGIMKQVLTNLSKPYDGEFVNSGTVASLVEKFLNTPKREDRQAILDKEIGDHYREPFIQLLTEFVGFYVSLSCLLFLFGYGFRYSNQLAEFMFAEDVKPIASMNIKLLPKHILLYAIKPIVCQDKESQHDDESIKGAISTLEQHLNTAYLDTNKGEKYSLSDIQRLAEAMGVL